MENISSWFVCLMGMGTVFVGLIILVLICDLVGVVFGEKPSKQAEHVEKEEISRPEAIPNKGELLAAISAAAAEDLGTDVSAIRILSLKKIS